MNTPTSKELVKKDLKKRGRQLARLLKRLEELSTYMDKNYHRPEVDFSYLRLATEFLRKAEDNYPTNADRFLSLPPGEL